MTGVPQVIVRRARHDRFDVVDEFVADEPDGAAGEPRQARHGHRRGTVFITRSTTSRPSRTVGRPRRLRAVHGCGAGASACRGVQP